METHSYIFGKCFLVTNKRDGLGNIAGDTDEFLFLEAEAAR